MLVRLFLLLILFCSLAFAQKESDADVYFQRGEAFLHSKQLKEAEAEFKKAIRLKPDWAEAYLKLGHVSQRYEDAVKAFEQAVKLKPDWAEAHYELASILRRVPNQGDRAIRSFKEAIRLKPDLTEAHEGLAVAYLYEQRFQEAIQSLLIATNLEPSRPLPHKLLGLVYLAIDERDKAIAEYKTLKSLDTEMADYLNNAIQSPTKPEFGVSNGRLISVPVPEYPDEARRQGIAGIVTVRVTINELGLVTDAQAVSGPPELYNAAKAAAMKARFTPTRLSGKPVVVQGVLTFNFHR